MGGATYHVDHLGTITQYRWCAEEGQYIERIIGNVYEFNQRELSSMGIQLDDRF
jgi:hypothetical protein